LSDDEKAGLREAAQARSLEGWLVPIVNTTGQPLLSSMEDRGLREEVFRASVDRGLGRDTQADHDTRDVLVRIARLRAERATLLGTLAPRADLGPWDWRFLAAREAAESALDPEKLRPYLEFERVLPEGVFAAATALYGITFHERPELVGYTDQARVFEVREE